MWNWMLLFVLIVFGISDLYLVSKKKKTISQRYHKLFPQRIDNIILIASVVIIGWVVPDARFVYYLLGIVVGHLAWREGG